MRRSVFIAAALAIAPLALFAAVKKDWTWREVRALAYTNQAVFHQKTVSGEIPLSLRSDMDETLLHLAVLKNHTTTVSWLLSNRISPALADKNGETPLFYARTPEMVHILLTHGSPLENRNVHGRTPLLYHASSDNEESVLLLLSFGADPSAADRNGWGIWHVLARSSGEHAATFYSNILAAKNRASFDQTNSLGQTPLHIAASFRNLSLAGFLLSAGSNPNAADRFGWTPLHYAAEAGSTKELSFEELITIKPRDTNTNFDTKEVFTEKSLRIARLLIEFGASIRAKTGADKEHYEAGLTPYDIAVRCKKTDMAALLAK